MICKFYACNEKATYVESFENLPSKCYFHSSHLSKKYEKYCDFQNCTNSTFIKNKCLQHYNIEKSKNTCAQCKNTYSYLKTNPICPICKYNDKEAAKSLIILSKNIT